MPDETPKRTPKRYQWPADKLTSTEMAVLYRIREATGVPINHLLRDAVQKLNDSTSGAPSESQNSDGHSNEKANPEQPQ